MVMVPHLHVAVIEVPAIRALGRAAAVPIIFI
jgi:hypothetical protein